jgi:hypothetical protein
LEALPWLRSLGRRGDHPVFGRDEVPAWLAILTALVLLVSLIYSAWDVEYWDVREYAALLLYGGVSPAALRFLTP